MTETSDTAAKVDFILEMEKLKGVLRKTRPVGLSRFENTAEHSWQTAMAALLFLPDGIDALKVLKMLLVHDIVEIDAGDVFVYDDQARKDAELIELAAAERIFGLLPEPLSTELLDIWKEFEARETPESIYAKAMDRVCPVIQNLNSEVSSWTEHGISRDRVLAKNDEIKNASQSLWKHLSAKIHQADLD